MKDRDTLAPGERSAPALDAIERGRPSVEVCAHDHVGPTTAYEIRDALLAGGRRALAGARVGDGARGVGEDGIA